MRVLGIDEAGRGCVLGPLVVGGFVIDDVSDADLTAAGACDSKQVTARRRVEIRARLVDVGVADVRRVEATAIDAGNLNALEEEVIAELVREWRPDRVVVDALGHPRTLPKVLARLEVAVAPHVATWLMEPKADHNHPVVGAASIFAKTTRDELLDALRPEFGALGSGYPSDPVTRAWLAAWSRSGRPWPSFVRTRWGTIDKVAQAAMF